MNLPALASSPDEPEHPVVLLRVDRAPDGTVTVQVTVTGERGPGWVPGSLCFTVDDDEFRKLVSVMEAGAGSGFYRTQGQT